MNKAQSGNVLFLILIAVALFAALSYAVTNSSRGGGPPISQEKAKASAARIVQEAGHIQATIMRFTVQGYFVLFNASAPNNSGTCYHGKTPVTPCKTIGIMSPEAGNYRPQQGTFDIVGVDRAESGWGTYSDSVSIAGVTAGTAEPDRLIWVDAIESQTCKEINRQLNGTATIYPYYNVSATGGYGYAGQYWYYDVSTNTSAITSTSSTTATQVENYPARSGCMGDGSGWNSFWVIFDDK